MIYCIFGLAFCLARPVYAADREYIIKAIFLYNFLNYVTWPDNLLKKNKASATLCIYGQDQFGEAFSYVQKKSKSEWTLTVKKLALADIEYTAACHILFVSNSEKHRIADFKEKLSSTGTLTVSDIDGFAGNGGIIELVTHNNKIKLVIDVAQLKKQGFKASSKLMKIAKIIGREASR